MQIIIPMTGYGSRFVAAGYKELKPFIKVQNKPIIQWIIEGMYPEEKNILFICRKEHLDKLSYMRDFFDDVVPFAKVFIIEDWIKKGPVYDVLRASDYIKDDIPCIINYCDFYMTWDYNQFKEDVKNNDCDGAVPCYTGFHPHLLIAKNVYASCNTDSKDNLIEIREKYSFSDDKMKAKHSPGVYYFKDGFTLKKYCNMMINEKDMLNGEYYASLPYNYMVRDGKKVWVPCNVNKFCQWGTPEDLSDYLFWTDCTRRFS